MKNDKPIYPSIMKITDNYGNQWTKGMSLNFDTKTPLFPGDKLEYIVDATDPNNNNIIYRVEGETLWRNEILIQFKIDEKHVSSKTVFNVLIKSSRIIHKYDNIDDAVHFSYKILPQKGTKAEQ